jgi:hypothetical protein
MSQSGKTARPAEQNRGSDSVERLLGRSHRGLWFAWYPVPLCKHITLPNGNGQWQSSKWAWLRWVGVSTNIYGETFYFLPNVVITDPHRERVSQAQEGSEP